MVIIADLKQNLVDDTLAEIRQAGGYGDIVFSTDLSTASAPSHPVDVTKPETVRAAFQHSIDQYGKPPDVVYANAGVSGDDWFEEDGEIGKCTSLRS